MEQNKKEALIPGDCGQLKQLSKKDLANFLSVTDLQRLFDVGKTATLLTHRGNVGILLNIIRVMPEKMMRRITSQ